MTEEDAWRAVPIPAGQADYLIATAARAPSVQNTQPWRFRVGDYVIELYADLGRKLKVDPAGRELLISCGAALFGLRQLRPLILIQRPGAIPAAALVRVDPVAQGAFVDAQVPGDLRDRLPGLPD